MEEQLTAEKKKPSSVKHPRLDPLIDDERMFQQLELWWKNTAGGHPGEIAIFRTLSTTYGGTPMKAVQRAIRFIVQQGLWG